MAAVEIHQHQEYNRMHHPRRTIGTFRNLGGNRRVRYDQIWEFLFEKARPRQNPGIPFQFIDPASLKSKIHSYQISWLGHSTVLVQTPKVTIITDPVFADRVSPIGFAGPKRFVQLPIHMDELPKIDAIIISHNHYDHLEKAAVQYLHKRYKPQIFVPMGVRKNLRSWGIPNAIEMDWWEWTETKGFKIHFLPARHFSGRSLTDYNRTLWGSWLVELDDLTFYFAGDTAQSGHFQQIGEKFHNIDMSFMPIGAYKPRAMMSPVHVDPEEAIDAHIALGADEMLAIHWGTYDLATEPLLEPMEKTQDLIREKNLHSDRIHILPIGGQLIR